MFVSWSGKNQNMSCRDKLTKACVSVQRVTLVTGNHLVWQPPNASMIVIVTTADETGREHVDDKTPNNNKKLNKKKEFM